jgi:RNA polymerase sigma-70 factor (ECF subfamily)
VSAAVKERMTSPEPADRHDFDRLFRDERAAVYRVLFAFTAGRRDVAEEATAEAFARAIAHRSGIREPLPWIYRTAFRIAKEELRRERRNLPNPAEAANDSPAGLGPLIAALRSLSPRQRAAIVLRYEADLPVDEIARRMGIRAPTVRVHLHRGRERLRQLLGTEEDDDD